MRDSAIFLRAAMFLLLGITLLGTTPSTRVAAELPATVLGNAGEVFTVRAGTYAELFPEGETADPEHTVLALDIMRSGDSGTAIERRLVPHTADAAVETSPFLVYGQNGDRLGILWQRADADTSASLELVRFADGTFAEEIVSIEAGFGSLRIALTEDRFELEHENGEVARMERHVVHLARIEDVDGERSVVYTPIIFLDGLYVEWREDFILGRLDGDLGVETELPEQLLMSVDPTHNAVTITYGSPSAGRLTTRQIAAVPPQLVVLSEKIHALALLGDLDPADPDPFIDIMGVEIIGVGLRARLEISVVEYLARKVGERIRVAAPDYDPDDPDHLAEDLRHFSLELACALFSFLGGSGDEAEIFEVVSKSRGAGENDTPARHILDNRRMIERPFPVVPEAENVLYQSEDGSGLLTAWRRAGAPATLWYSEWRAGEWSAARPLNVGESLSLTEALGLLRHRIR